MFETYAQEHPKDVFLRSYNQYKILGTFKNPAYKAIEPGSWNNIFSWGYWNIYLPEMQKELRLRGVCNPIHDVIHDNVYVIEGKEDSFLKSFYPLHYQDSLYADTVQIFGKLALLKYKVKVK